MTNLGTCVHRLAPHRPSAARCRPAILPPRAGQVPRGRSAILTSPPAPTLQPPEPAVLCMAVACFRECCQHAPVSRTAGSGSLLSLCWLSGRGGFKPDREFIRAKVSPGCLAGGQGSLFLLLRFPSLGDGLPAPALRYARPPCSPPLSDPTPRRVSHRSRRY